MYSVEILVHAVKKQLCLPSVPTASRSGPEHIWLLISFVCFVFFLDLF